MLLCVTLNFDRFDWLISSLLQRILVENELAWNDVAMLQGMTLYITVRNGDGSV